MKYCKKCLTEVLNDDSFSGVRTTLMTLLQQKLMNIPKPYWYSQMKTSNGEFHWYYCPNCDIAIHLGETIGISNMRDKKLRKLL